MAYAEVVSTTGDEYMRWHMRLRAPDLGRDDVATLAVVVGLIGGCVLLGLLAGWYAGLGLFFVLLVAWGLLTLSTIPGGHSLDLAAERHDLET